MLSRASLPNTEEEEENVNMCPYLPIGNERMNKIKKKVLVKLKNFILKGWPDERTNVPTVLVPYYNFTNEMTDI